MSEAYLFSQLFANFARLLPGRKDTHPIGCHNPRISDQRCFTALWQMGRSGLSYREAARLFGISKSTLLRRRAEWGPVIAQLELAILQEYERRIGLVLAKLVGDSSITKAPCGGEVAGPSPVDRRKLGMKLSQVTDGNGIPLVYLLTGANRSDCTLLQPLLALLDKLVELPDSAAMYLDKGYDTRKCHGLLEKAGIADRIVRKGHPYPKRRAVRWVVERSNSWHHNHKKLLRMTERTQGGARFFVSLANASIVLRALLNKRPGAALPVFASS